MLAENITIICSLPSCEYAYACIHSYCTESIKRLSYMLHNDYVHNSPMTVPMLIHARSFAKQHPVVHDIPLVT